MSTQEYNLPGELVRKYEEIEGNINEYRWSFDGNKNNPQLIALCGRLKENIRKISLSEKLPALEFGNRLTIACDLLDHLNCEMVPGGAGEAIHDVDGYVNFYNNKKSVWHHQPSSSFSLENLWKEQALNNHDINSLAATYLKHEWLQMDELDWIFIDSMIFTELRNYVEHLFSHNPDGSISWSYISAGGNTTKMIKYKLVFAIGIFVLRYILPTGLIGAFFFFGLETLATIALFLYSGYLIIHFALWPFKYFKDRKEEAKHKRILEKMEFAYSRCIDPVSTKLLKNCVDEAKEQGAVFPTAVHLLVDRAYKKSDILTL